MNIRAFTGAAGTGKTTRLMECLDARLTSSPLDENKCVLALTRMHGSRLRLIDRLGATAARSRFDCMTFDRLAWELTCRWRSRLRELEGQLLSEFDYDATCDAAGRLLALGEVAKWVAARYPIAVVDEFQDCRGGRLEIVKGLARHSDLLIAADEFQDLHGTGPSEAVAWLRGTVHVEDLLATHRTSDTGLLAVAGALRTGANLSDHPNAKVFSAPNANVAAGYLARGIAWAAGDQVVVLSATTSKNAFVRSALARLAEKSIGKGKGFGPYHVNWEQSRDDLESKLCERLRLPDDANAVVAQPAFGEGARLPGQREVEHWIEAQSRLRGSGSLACHELRSRVRRCIQHLRSQPRHGAGLRAMTIHQAKNREFDRVLILWPVAVPGDTEVQRRLLYNAVTRAKKAATIIVQDPNPQKSRLRVAPFLLP